MSDTENTKQDEQEETEETGNQENQQASSSDDKGKSSGGSRPSSRRPRNRRGRRRRTQYCPDGRCFDYKDVDTLRRYLSDTGKIKPRRQTGNCARCQRQLATEIKRARHLALLPFVITSDT